MNNINKSIYSSGIRFECQACGQCCQTRDDYSHVYLTLPERRRLAEYLGLTTRSFTNRYCSKENGRYFIKDPDKGCLFFKNSRCSVYKARPQQCLTWPFWPENMTSEVWSKEVVRDCPGIGKGRLFSPEEIEDFMAEEYRRENKF